VVVVRVTVAVPLVFSTVPRRRPDRSVRFSVRLHPESGHNRTEYQTGTGTVDR